MNASSDVNMNLGRIVVLTNMFQWLTSYIVSKFKSIFSSQKALLTYTKEDYQRILFSETAENEEKKEDDLLTKETKESKCEHRIGKVTRLEPNYGLIDGRYYFEIADVKQKNLKVGQNVRYLAYRSNENVEWKVKQINIIEPDEWQSGGGEAAVASRVTEEYVAIEKTLTAQVIEKQNRFLTMIPNDITCNLDCIECEFLPIKGDWVSLTAVVEVRDENNTNEHIIDIKYLKPLRSKMFEGKVSHLSEYGTGIIGNSVYFTENICADGSMPAVNDRVVARVIESEQGALIWRAIHLRIVETVSLGDTLIGRIVQERLFDSKCGIAVSATCDKMALKIGEATTFKVAVENAGQDSQILTAVQLKNSEYSNVMRLLHESFEPITITSGTSYRFEVSATAKSSGYYSELMVLHFEGDWKIGHMLDIYVHIEEEYGLHTQNNSSQVHPGNATSNNNTNNNTNDSRTNVRYPRNQYQARRQTALLKTMPTKMGFVVPGVRPVRPAAFLPKHLPDFTIPDKIRTVMVGENDSFKSRAEILSELETEFSYLVQNLSGDNYSLKFHTLLNLEDHELSVAIKKFDRDQVSFSRHGEFLVMEIPNLSESRPSLVVGDKLIASPCALDQKSDAVSYEGYIHRVMAHSIKLKFGETFQNQYDGKSMSVTFVHSRTAVRRAHQAVNEVYKWLGKMWLFPKALGTLKPYQVNIVGEYPADVPEEKHVCESSVSEENPVSKSLPSKKLIRNRRKVRARKTVTLASLGDSETDDSDAEEQTENEITSPEHGYGLLKRPDHNKSIRWEEENRRRPENGTKTTPPKANTRTKMQCPDVIVKWVNPVLNKYQRSAIRNILKGEARPLPYIIHGPPGTGKTITVVETVLQIMFLIPDSRILIATPSNSSADLLCERLLSWNLLKAGDLVRLVGYNYMVENRMSPTLKPYCTCLDTKSLDKNPSKISYDEDGVKYSSREVIGRHRITVGTCVSLGVLYTMGFPKNHFTHIIVDEAGQSSEPDIMIPLAFLNNENGQAILAGDPLQLGPVINSREALTFGLDQSLLSRLFLCFPYGHDPEGYPETNGYDPRLVTRLLYNYRSLPNILDLYSTLFYKRELIPTVCSTCSKEKDLLNKIKNSLREDQDHEVSEVIFHGVKGTDMQDEDSPSWYNNHEITRVVRYVSDLYREGLKSEDIGIVTPYQKQVFKLRELLRLCELEVPKVGTVEEFQGQERNVIIISTVRSNHQLVDRDLRHSLGFVSSQPRLNVAISRARSMLIIVGNPHLLSRDPKWRALIKMCVKGKNYVGCDLPSELMN